jgi:hypothetical protein
MRLTFALLAALLLAAPAAAQTIQVDTTGIYSDRQLRQRITFQLSQLRNIIAAAEAAQAHAQLTYDHVHRRIVRDSLRAVAPPPPDTAPNPFGYDSSAVISYTQAVAVGGGTPYPTFTLTYVTQRVELCRVAFYGKEMRPFPSAVQFRFITPNPPIKAIGGSQRGEHCHWFEALQPGVDLGAMGVRAMRPA